MLLVHSTTECGYQIVKFFAPAHNQLPRDFVAGRDFDQS
jgi:hypothetical protein